MIFVIARTYKAEFAAWLLVVQMRNHKSTKSNKDKVLRETSDAVCEQDSCIKANCTHAEPIAELWPIAQAGKDKYKTLCGAQRSIKQPLHVSYRAMQKKPARK